jgi:predicted metal-dependent hydrolase
MPPSLELGIALFNAREFYECHEALENVWMSEHGPRRLFLQAIIHFAVAFHHAERQNAAGAMRQLRKGLLKLDAYRPVYEGVDTERLFRDGESALSQLADGNAAPPTPRIRRI